MKPKFEYPGYELEERDEQFKLMLAWADYNDNFQRNADTIRQIGTEDNPAVVIEQANGTLVLKRQHEIQNLRQKSD